MKSIANRRVLAKLMNFLKWDEIINVYSISSLLHPDEYNVLVELDKNCTGILSIYRLTNALTVRGNLLGLTKLLPKIAKLKGYWCFAILPHDMFIMRKFISMSRVKEYYLMIVNKGCFKSKLIRRVKVLTEEHLYQVPSQSNTPYDKREINYLVRKRRVYGSFTEEGVLASLAFIQDETTNVVLIGGVYTKSEFRRQGYAKSCLSKMINYLLLKYKIVGLIVRVDNIPAINLYKSLGFSIYTRLLGFEIT